jgi:hypothetical protein
MATEPPCGELGDELAAELLLPDNLEEVLAQLILQHLCPAVHSARQNNLKETKTLSVFLYNQCFIWGLIPRPKDVAIGQKSNYLEPALY